MSPARHVTIVIHTDGALDSRQYRVPLWMFEVGKWGAVGVVLLVILFFVFAGPIMRAAGRVPALERQVARLQSDNARVQELAQALNRAEANYQALRALLGAKAPPPGSGRAATPATDAGADLMRAVPVAVTPPGAPLRYELGLSTPSHWPLDVPGYVTRGEAGAGDQESHPGIDIAVPVGSVVRASGGGTVEAAGNDSSYGLFVLLRHPGGYESMYGHASRLLVREGDTVSAGQVIALSGNTGRSTAPHLHFEIRRDGKPIDPLAVVKEEN